MGDEHEQDAWLRNTLRPSPEAASEACLDAETLAAWADGGLSAKAAEAVELHASSCPRCMAVLATMERTAPAPTVTHGWTPMRLFRWAAPLAAAATAVAIWVAVPDRTMAPIESTSERAEQAPVPVPLPVPEAVTEPGTMNQKGEPGTEIPERGTPTPQPEARTPEPEKSQLRDELRRERSAPQTLGSAAAPPEPDAAPVPPPAAPAPRAFAADTVAESATAATAQRSATSMSLTAKSAESISPSNSLLQWRVVQPPSVERSLDGGQTWTKTTLPAPDVVAIRAVDADRAVATTSDNTVFYTSDAGRSWTRVQENSAAPF